MGVDGVADLKREALGFSLAACWVGHNLDRAAFCIYLDLDEQRMSPQFIEETPSGLPEAWMNEISMNRPCNELDTIPDVIPSHNLVNSEIRFFLFRGL